MTFYSKRMRALWRTAIPFMVVLLTLAACTSSSEGGDPTKTVTQYLTAKVAGDEAALRPLLCSAMEADVALEASSFAAVDAKLDGMSCTHADGSDTVTCTGKIVVTYGTEDRDFPLSTYNVVQEDGQWKWCGEAAP